MISGMHWLKLSRPKIIMLVYEFLHIAPSKGVKKVILGHILFSLYIGTSKL